MTVAHLLTPGAEISPALRERISGDAVIAFLEASTDWHLSEDEELWLAGDPAPDAFRTWCDAALEGRALCLKEPVLQRLSLVAGFHKAIAAFLPEPALQARWLRSCNLRTGPRPPIACIGDASLEDLAAFQANLVERFSRFPLKCVAIVEASLPAG